MKKWLTQELSAPRWLIAGVMVLSVIAFVMVQVKAHDLHQQMAWAEHELAELTCNRKDIVKLCSINQLMPPPIATITMFPEMRLGLVCIICSLVGGMWILVNNHRQSKSDEKSSQ